MPKELQIDVFDVDDQKLGNFRCYDVGCSLPCFLVLKCSRHLYFKDFGLTFSMEINYYVSDVRIVALQAFCIL